jgi:hypothetical protein
MIETSQSIKALMTALLTVQGSVQGVAKDSSNPFFKNRYASLEAVIETIRKPMTDAGLIFTQAPGAIIAGAVEITTMIAHQSGEWMRSTLHVPLAKTDPQGVGSAITYGCRYALMATLGLPPLDDDAEAAVRHQEPKRASAKPIEAKQTVPDGLQQLADTPMPKQLPSEKCTRLIEQINLCKTADALDTFVSSPTASATYSSLTVPEKKRVMAAKDARYLQFAEKAA